MSTTATALFTPGSILAYTWGSLHLGAEAYTWMMKLAPGVLVYTWELKLTPGIEAYA